MFMHLLFVAVLVRRDYLPVPVFTIRVLLTVEFGLNILRESRDVNDVFICAKNRFQREYLLNYRNIF